MSSATGVEQNAQEAMRDHARALELFIQGADAGYPPAQNNFGMLLLSGDMGVTVDNERGCEYLRMAAEQNDPQACTNLGHVFLKGEGAEQDADKANYWFRHGAEQGFASAQYYLALMYIQGQSVERDLVEAYMWLDLAVKQDSREALKTRGLITKQLSPAEINEAEERVEAWRPVVH